MSDDLETMRLFASEELEDEQWALKDGKSLGYWYDGPPDFAKSDFEFDGTYRTVLVQCMFGGPPTSVIDEEGVTWNLLHQFAVNPERECPEHGGVVQGETPCSVCDAQPGEQHGHAYIGEAWFEAVYQSEES